MPSADALVTAYHARGKALRGQLVHNTNQVCSQQAQLHPAASCAMQHRLPGPGGRLHAWLTGTHTGTAFSCVIDQLSMSGLYLSSAAACFTLLACSAPAAGAAADSGPMPAGPPPKGCCTCWPEGPCSDTPERSCGLRGLRGLRCLPTEMSLAAPAGPSAVTSAERAEDALGLGWEGPGSAPSKPEGRSAAEEGLLRGALAGGLRLLPPRFCRPLLEEALPPGWPRPGG